MMSEENIVILGGYDAWSNIVFILEQVILKNGIQFMTCMVHNGSHLNFHEQLIIQIRLDLISTCKFEIRIKIASRDALIW